LIGGVYEYAPAHGAFDMFVPPSTRPVKSRKEVFDHAQRTEGVATVWVGYGHGVCTERGGPAGEDACVVVRSYYGTYIISKHL